MTQHSHQPRHQPSGHDADLLHNALFDPEEKLVRFLKQASRCHCAPSASMPALIPLLLLDGLLKHGLQPTISATCRGSCSCRIAKSSPFSRRRNEMNLTVESPLSPLLANAISHHEPSHVAVRPLVQVVRPTL